MAGPTSPASDAAFSSTASLVATIVHDSQEAFFVLDPDRDFRVMFVNDAACRHFRRTREELHTLSPVDWDPVATLDTLRDMWRTWTGTGVPFVFETTHRRGDGTLVPVEVFGSVLRHEDRQVAFGSIRDITARKRVEEALRESEDRYRDLVEHSQDLICTHDLEGRVLTVNPQAAELLGYPRDEVLRMRISDVLTPEDRVNFPKYMQRLQQNGAASGVMHVITASGERRIWEFHNSLRRDRVAGPVVRGMAHDITERDRALNALHESEERLRLALQAANQGLYDLDVRTGEAQVSPEYATMLGYDPAEFRETNAAWIERLHPDDRDPVAASYRDYIAGRIPEYRVEFRQRTRTGDWKWILSLGRVVERDRSGAPTRMLGTHTDITERKQTELALAHEASRRRVLFEHAADGIVVVDERGTVVEANASFARMLGCDDVRDAGAFIAAFPETPGTSEVQLRRCDGSTFDAEISFTPTQWAGQNLLFYVCRDITERRRSEAERSKLQAQLVQAQKMESVGRLAGGVAHDFNNMLSVILGYTELALSTMDAANPLHKDLQEIRQAARRSSDLTRQLLAFSRRQTVAPRILDLNETVSAALKMVRRLIGEDIELTWSPGGGLWAANVDPAQIDQVLLNLAVNARDAIEGVGKVAIATTNAVVDGSRATRTVIPPGDYVLLTVQDDGCGMAPEVLEHLFEPFYTTKPLGQGTGLGLATVYGIVSQHGGFIDVTSAPGEGAAFHVYLPRAKRSTTRHEEVKDSNGVLRNEGRGRTVLLVEDEAAILRLGRTLLESIGYVVLSAGTPAEALRIAASHTGRIDLLVTDVVMPGMDGRQLALQLMASCPGLRCLFMSGYTDDVIAHRGILFEGVHYLPKPFTRQELAAKVREILRDDDDNAC